MPRMIETEHGRNSMRVARALSLVLLAAVGVLWSWNTVAVDLFAAPSMAYRHALALLLLAVVLGTAAAWAFRAACPRPRRGAG
jgi:uncharacterized membrane protein YwzB